MFIKRVLSAGRCGQCWEHTSFSSGGTHSLEGSSRAQDFEDNSFEGWYTGLPASELREREWWWVKLWTNSQKP